MKINKGIDEKGISGEDFQNEEKLKVFQVRVNDFIKKYYVDAGDNKDLYLGYIVHLLTDELFNIMVRKRFVEAMKKDGINQNEIEFFKKIISDIESVDRILTKRYVFTENVTEILESVWNYEIADYISADEINRSKRWVIDSFFKGEESEISPVYYSYEEAVDFIDFAVENICSRLSSGGDVCKII